MTKNFRVFLKSAIAIGTMITVLSGCASQPDDIATRSVSPILYQDLNCRQIAFETYRVETRIEELYASLKKTANTDAVQMGVGSVLLWPVLFALEGGDGVEAAEFARLKGERDALNRVALQKSCGGG